MPVEKPARYPLTDRLFQLADGASLSLMARLAPDQNGWPVLFYDKPVQVSLDRLKDYNVPHKWRHGILLLSHNAWLVRGEGDPVPWALMKRLRQAEIAGGGLLPLKDITATARQLTAEQLQRLADEFPVMGNIASYRDLFSLMDHSPSFAKRLLSPQGIRLSEALTVLENRLPQEIDRSRIAAVRLAITERRGGEKPRTYRSFMFQALSPEGKVLAGGGFGDQSRETSPAEEEEPKTPTATTTAVTK
jgi:hypothetical protein